MRRASFLVGVLALGCEADPGPPPEERNAIDPHGWMQADEAVDAFANLRPADAMCDPVMGWKLEWLGSEPALEVNTGWCNYITVSQPLLEDIHAGDPMKLRLWHYELVSGAMPGTPQAYVAAAIGGEKVWEQTIPIPTAGKLEVGEWEAPADADAGTDVQFHVHNHGVNTYELLTITVTN